jgi:hypothetical protein
MHQYETKIERFLQDNNFHAAATNPTNKFQTQIRNTIRNSKNLIPKDSIWKYINMNASAPSIKGLIKLHKLDQLIRPVVNWCNTLAYNLSTLFINKINHLIPLPNAFNIINTQDLIQDLKDTPMLPHFSLASMDITNLY